MHQCIGASVHQCECISSLVQIHLDQSLFLSLFSAPITIFPYIFLSHPHFGTKSSEWFWEGLRPWYQMVVREQNFQIFPDSQYYQWLSHSLWKVLNEMWQPNLHLDYGCLYIPISIIFKLDFTVIHWHRKFQDFDTSIIFCHDFQLILHSIYISPMLVWKSWELKTDCHVTIRDLLDIGLLSLQNGSRLALVEHHPRKTDSPGQLGCCGRCRLAANQDMHRSAGQNIIFMRKCGLEAHIYLLKQSK